MFSDVHRPLKIVLCILFLAIVSLGSFLGRFSLSPWFQELRSRYTSFEGRLIPLSYVTVVARSGETVTLDDGFTQWQFHGGGELPVGATVSAMVLLEDGGIPRIVSWEENRHRVSKHVISLLPLFYLMVVFAKRYRLDLRRVMLVCRKVPPSPVGGTSRSDAVGGTREEAKGRA